MTDHHGTALHRWRTTWATLAREVHRQFGVSPSRQAAEILYFRKRLGTGREEYYLYRLFDTSRPLAERLQTLSMARWRPIIHAINPPARAALADNKTAFGALMREAGVPCPGTLGVFDASFGYTAAGSRLSSPADLHRLLADAPAQGVVVKDESGGMGDHVHVFRHVDGSKLWRMDGSSIHVDELYALLTAAGPARYIVQPRLQGHASLTPLAGSGLMTFRVATILDRAHGPRVIRAAARIPVHGNGVDNFSAGNVAAPVDVHTGALGVGCKKYGFESFDRHPVSGAPIAGYCVPAWPALLDVVRRAAETLAPLPCIGWDVALAESGPVVIEANRQWRFDVLQRPHRSGLWQGEFKEWCEAHASARTGRERVT